MNSGFADEASRTSVPSCTLTVTSLTRFTVDNLDDTGKTVGRLNALNTIGSIIGTFVPTFVTIPAVGTAATFLIFSGVLAAIGIAYFVFEKKKSVPGIVSVLLIAGLCFALPSYSFAFWQSDITLEDESIYNYLQVQDDAKRTTLSTNVLFGVQSVQVKGDALTGMYYDYALAAPCMAGMDGTDNENRSVMILGMGSGTYASYCTRYFPGASVQGAEIDKKIADIATDYFGLPGSVTVAVEDGRAYLAASKEKFDVIMVDAYQDITIPFQLSSVEFFNEVCSHLKPNALRVRGAAVRPAAAPEHGLWRGRNGGQCLPWAGTGPCEGRRAADFLKKLKLGVDKGRTL